MNTANETYFCFYCVITLLELAFFLLFLQNVFVVRICDQISCDFSLNSTQLSSRTFILYFAHTDKEFLVKFKEKLQKCSTIIKSTQFDFSAKKPSHNTIPSIGYNCAMSKSATTVVAASNVKMSYNTMFTCFVLERIS